MVSFDLTSHVSVIAGSQYTWEITTAGGGDPAGCPVTLDCLGLSFDTISGGSYSGGRSLVFSFHDHKFQTFIAAPPALPDICLQPISLTPDNAINLIGTPHTVTFTVTACDPAASPVPDVPVIFTAWRDNPLLPIATGSEVTDEFGEVTFTYTNTVPGFDVIEAEVVGTAFPLISNHATKEWTESQVIFSNPVPDLFPNADILSCVIGIFRGEFDEFYPAPGVPGETAPPHQWYFKSQGPGGPSVDDPLHTINLDIRAFAVNAAQERGGIRATAYGPSGAVIGTPIVVTHPDLANGENSDTLTLTGIDDDVKYGLVLELVDPVTPYTAALNPELTVSAGATTIPPDDPTTPEDEPLGPFRTARHYKVGVAERYVELGWGLFDRPLHYLEPGRNDWIIHVDGSEAGGVAIGIDVDPGQATSIEYAVAEAGPTFGSKISGGGPNGGLVATSLVSGTGTDFTFTFTPTTGVSIYRVMLNGIDGHYFAHKITGSDRGFYLLPCGGSPPAPPKPPPAEARTIGFWKNHEDDLLQHLPQSLGTLNIPDDALGLALALDILNSAKAKNADNMLAAQLLAAKLNVAVGVPPCAQGAIDKADLRLTNAGYYGPDTTTPPQKNLKKLINNVKNKLDEFNNNGCPAP